MATEKIDLPKRKPILCVDFDGVIHSYVSGWKGARNIPGPPIPGAIEWLKSLIPAGDDVCAFDTLDNHFFQVAIFSSRSRYLGGRRAMKKYLLRHGISKYQLEYIKFPLLKPPAFLIIDDRAWQFMGKFPGVSDMSSFRPCRMYDKTFPGMLQFLCTSSYSYSKEQLPSNNLGSIDFEKMTKYQLVRQLMDVIEQKSVVKYIKHYDGRIDSYLSLYIITEEEFQQMKRTITYIPK